MKRKLFIAINLPVDTKKRLAKITSQWLDLPVRWVPQKNLHLTLAFLGYFDDQSIPNMIEKLDESISKNNSFELNFDNIQLGPDKLDPKMVWLVGPANPDLAKLHEKIGRAIGLLSSGHKQFCPHITLGKIKRKILAEQEKSIEIGQRFSATFPVYSVELMSSELTDDGAEYLVLETFNLK